MSTTKTDARPGTPQPDLFGEQSGGVSARPPRKRATPKPIVAKPVSAKPAQPQSVHGGLVNTQQAALRLGLCKSTLDKMRCKGKGPRFIKSTDRAVRYDPADLDAWIAARRRQATEPT